MYARDKKCLQGFWWGNLKERYHSEGPGVDGKVILRWFFSNLDGRRHELD